MSIIKSFVTLSFVSFVARWDLYDVPAQGLGGPPVVFGNPICRGRRAQPLLAQSSNICLSLVEFWLK
jgi:hypothetical protein